MKFLIAALAIAMMVQVSMAEPLGRSKRNAKFVRDFERMATTGRLLVNSIEIVMKATISKIPPGNAYAPYRDTLQASLEAIESYNLVAKNCLKDTYELLEKLVTVIRLIQRKNLSEHGNNVADIYQQSGGVLLDKDLAVWDQQYDNSNFKIASKTLTEDDTEKIKEIMGYCA